MAGCSWKQAAAVACGIAVGLRLFLLWRVRAARRRKRAMDFTFEFSETAEAQAFFQRHPNFHLAFEHLCVLINRCFGRPIPKPPGYIQFGLGESCREDFLEITFLAVNGYGGGASKLLRGLYERAVALAYMVKNPEKTERFARFAAVQEYRALGDALKVTTEEQWDAVMGEDNSADKIRGRLESVRAEFQQTDCKKCTTKRLATTWDLYVVDMVREVGAPYDTYYLIAYTTANVAIHATLSSALRERNRAQDTLGAQHRDQADTVLFCAAMLMVEVLRSQNTLFSLGLSDDLQSSEEAIARAWKDSIDARNTRS